MSQFRFLSHTLFLLGSLWSFGHTSFVAAEPANLSHLRNEIISYHDSGDYLREVAQVITRARAYLLNRVNENLKSEHPTKLAVVLDIDETSLSNYPNMLSHNFVGTKEQFHQQALDANAQVIRPTLSLYNEARAHEVAIFFITGRPESEREATITNLKHAGFTDWNDLYLRPESKEHVASIVPFKSQMRANIIKQGYTVIATIGDQYSDLNGGFAEQGFKLPNPYYYLP